MGKLKRLKIDKFRNVKPGTVLEFNDGFNVVLGRNATGKTTLLELVAQQVRGDFINVAEDLSMETSLSLTHASAVVHVATQVVGVRQVGDAVETDAETFAGLSLSTIDGALEISGEGTTGGGRTLVNGAPREYESGRRHAFQSLLASAMLHVEVLGLKTAGWPLLLDLTDAACNRQDEALLTFERFTEGTGFRKPFASEESNAARPTHLLPLRFAQRVYGNWPGNGATTARFRLPQLIGHPELEDLLDAKAVYAEVPIQEKRVGGTGETIRFGQAVIHVEDRFGNVAHHSRLSFGQKRLLSFFLNLGETGDVVVADELVNGLHRDWIQGCMTAIGDRQAFLTSQNPLLLDFLPDFTSAEQARRTFIICEREKGTAGDQLVWRNLSEEEAKDFFAAYQRGVQYVGEILTTRGLW